MSSEEATTEQDMAVSAIEVFHTLEVISQETDPEGKYQDQVDALMESFSEGDDSAETDPGSQQAMVHWLYGAVQEAASLE